MKDYSRKVFRIFRIKSIILPVFLSFVLSSLIMYFFRQTIDIFSLVGLLITFVGAIFIAISVFSCSDELRSVNGGGSKNKIFPLALINPKQAGKGIKIMFLGFGIQLAHEMIKIIIP